LDPTSDEQLMLDVADGDMSAFAQLVQRHHRSALNIAYRFLSDAGRAEDIVQDAFLKILSAAERYRPTARFRTYLYNVIWHLCVDSYRKKRPQRLGETPLKADAAENPETVAMTEERAVLVRQAIQELPTRQRMALVLKHYENMSYDGIAEALGCSEGAVDSLLVRARRALQEKLKDLR